MVELVLGHVGTNSALRCGLDIFGLICLLRVGVVGGCEGTDELCQFLAKEKPNLILKRFELNKK